MNWFKKKFEAFAAKLNEDDAPLAASTDKEGEEESHATGRGVKPGEQETDEGRAPIKIPDPDPKPASRVDNMEELKEITLGAINNTVRMLGYGKAVIAGLVFHSRFRDNAIENVGLMSLTKDPSFINRLKRDFKSRGIAFKEDLTIEVVHESPATDKVSVITNGIGVEVLTPNETLKRAKAKLIATEGVTWEPEYILEPTGKYYFIGRGKDPKIENGPKIHNDIAFVGIEEKNEEQYKINNFISRSHAAIVFDKEIGAYKIYRSKFLNNPSHKIKIFNASLQDFTGVTLSQSTVPHVLKNGDSITFNDAIVLEFYLLN